MRKRRDLGQIVTIATGQSDRGVPADFSKREDHANIFEQMPFLIEIFRAVGDLARKWFVCRWSAADGGADVNAIQLQSIVAILGDRLIGQARAVESGEEEIAAAVAGEYAAGSVGAVGGGREADDPDARRWIAEPADGFAPVLPIEIGAAFFPRDELAIFPQAGASNAGRYFITQLLECVHQTNPFNPALARF